MPTYKPGDRNYTLSRLHILPIENVFPHEAVRETTIYSIMESMNRFNPHLRKKMSPLPVMVTKRDDGKYVILDGMHRYGAILKADCKHILAYVAGEDEFRIKGWDEIVTIPGELDLQTTFEQTISDLAELTEDEYAGGITVVLKKEKGHDISSLQEKVENGEISFAVLDKNDVSWWIEKEDGSELNLYEKVQFMKDFDEALEEITGFIQGNTSALNFTADDASANDFYSSEQNKAIVIRTRFKKTEVLDIAGEEKLCPKKTTRCIFNLRPFVQVPMTLLKDRLASGKEKRKEMLKFIDDHCGARFYPEPTYNLMDVNKKLDISSSYLGRKNMEAISEEISNDPYRKNWALEWAPKDTYITAVPGPTGFAYHGATVDISTPIVGHRSPAFAELYRKTTEGIKWVINQEGSEQTRTYDAYLIGGSASLAMEIALLSSVPPKGGVLHIIAGAFGHRWESIAEGHKMGREIVQIKPGHAISSEKYDEIKERLKTGLYDAVTVVHNETSTGTVYPIDKIYKVIAETEREINKDILYLVDAATSFAGMPIPGLSNIDFLVISTEKCLGVPPGVSALVVSPKGFKKNFEIEYSTARPLGFSTRLSKIHEYHLKNQTLTTPAITQIIMTLNALHSISGYITADGRVRPGEGISGRFDRFAYLSKKVREWGNSLGMVPLAKEEDHFSNSVTALVIKDLPVTGDNITDRCLRFKDMEISAGHRQLVDEDGEKIDMLRIPTMGAMEKTDLMEILENITDVIDDYFKDPALGLSKKDQSSVVMKLANARRITASII